MRKYILLFTVLPVMAIGRVGAQNGAHLPCTQMIDSNYNGFMFNHPVQGNMITDGFLSYNHENMVFTGMGYHSPTPMLVYGVAVNACTLYSSRSTTEYINPHLGYCLGALLVREGSSYVIVDSVRMKPYFKKAQEYRNIWLPHRLFDIASYGWGPSGLGDVMGDPVGEFYFEQPLLVQDSFFVGIWNNEVGRSIMRLDFLLQRISNDEGHYPIQEDLLILTNQGRLSYMDRNDHYWGGCFPIIKPYEEVEGEIVCDTVPGFHLAGMRVGYPTFAWDTDFCREEELFEVQFAPYHPGTATPDEAWRTVTTADSSIEVYSVFDPDIYYQARIRARRHHLCPIHDTVMWGPWCDPILFYTGSTEPDTTTAITPVEGGPDGLFTLSPNPATGTVTVTLGHTPQSLRDSWLHWRSPTFGSPNLGEEFSITLTDAAGREVLRKEFSIVNCQFSIPLDLSGLAAGTYYVTLTTPTATGTQRLVVR